MSVNKWKYIRRTKAYYLKRLDEMIESDEFKICIQAQETGCGATWAHGARGVATIIEKEEAQKTGKLWNHAFLDSQMFSGNSDG